MAASTRSFSVITWRTRRSRGPAGRIRRSRRGASRRPELRGPPALLAALVVARLGEAARAARVEHGERVAPQVERDRPRLERAHVEPDGAALLAEDRGELVEQPGLHAGVLVLDPLAELGELGRRRTVPAGDGSEGKHQADAQGRRGREARLAREVALDAHRRARQFDPDRAELRHGAAQVRVVVGQVRADHRVAVPQFRCHGDPQLDREGQADAEVVIGVLADQIHASRGESPAPVRVHGRHPTGARARPWTHGGERPMAITPKFDR